MEHANYFLVRLSVLQLVVIYVLAMGTSVEVSPTNENSSVGFATEDTAIDLPAEDKGTLPLGTEVSKAHMHEPAIQRSIAT